MKSMDGKIHKGINSHVWVVFYLLRFLFCVNQHTNTVRYIEICFIYMDGFGAMCKNVDNFETKWPPVGHFLNSKMTSIMPLNRPVMI